MKLATWNLQRPNPNNLARCTAIGDWVSRINADVWVLTETNDAISPGPQFKFVSTTATDRPGRAGERWTTVWSRWHIERLFETADPARSVAALVQPPVGAPLVVYGTVLPWVGSRWGGQPAQGGLAFAAALETQRGDWMRIREQFPNADLCVLGDLNQDLAIPHFYGSAAGRRALRDALSSVGLTALTADESDPVRALDPIQASIDHICVAAECARFNNSLLEAWPPRTELLKGLSDHFGSAASFTSTEV